MRDVLIYMITSPTGKVYIGSTLNLKDRLYRYKTYRCKSQKKLYNSLKKYSFESHDFKIIFKCKEKDRNYFEAYYGIMYNVIGNNGLNCQIPKMNESVVCMSEETRRKIGLVHKGKTISEAQKKQMKENLSNWLKNNAHPMKGKDPWNKGKGFLKGENNPMYGVKRSSEWKINHSIRMSKINKSGIYHPKSKSIIDIQNGIYYDSILEVSKYNNITYSSLKSRIRRKKEKRFICLN